MLDRIRPIEMQYKNIILVGCVNNKRLIWEFFEFDQTCDGYPASPTATVHRVSVPHTSALDSFVVHSLSGGIPCFWRLKF